jgi:predicted short-subunit dehydrogenase-like oxidoreductase (DUF2520 family)
MNTQRDAREPELATESSFDVAEPLGIVGLGALGSALVRTFRSRGVDVRVFSRGHEHVARAHALGARASGTLESLAECTALIVCVADDAIRAVAEHARAAGLAPRVALHTSGCTSVEALGALRERGAALGFFHPLVPVVRAGELESGTPIGVGGDPAARAFGAALAALASGRTVEVRGGAQARYHGAAALAAGGTVALFEVARALLEGALVDPTEAVPVVRALVGGAARNLAAATPTEALTGPFVRGDIGTVEAHLVALAADDPAARRARKVLAALAPVLVDLAAGRAEDPTELRARFERVLADLAVKVGD